MMSAERISETDPRVQGALDELRTMIQSRFPAASFQVSQGEDPEGIYLDATVDVDDTDEVMDMVIDRVLELQIDDGLPIHVIPQRPLERVLAELRSEKESGRRSRWHGASLTP